MLRSVDAGLTWRQVSLPPRARYRTDPAVDFFDRWANSYNDLQFADRLNGWIVGAGGLVLATTDGGATWTKARHPNFQFVHADVFNRYYNPRGLIAPMAYRYPLEDNSVDLVMFISVMTHLLPETIDRHLAESHRVLRRGGPLFATLFLLNDGSERLIGDGQSRLIFPHRSGSHALLNPRMPEHAVAYDESAFTAMLARHGLWVPTIAYGSWSGRTSYRSFQDTVVATKR